MCCSWPLLKGDQVSISLFLSRNILYRPNFVRLPALFYVFTAAGILGQMVGCWSPQPIEALSIICSEASHHLKNSTIAFIPVPPDPDMWQSNCSSVPLTWMKCSATIRVALSCSIFPLMWNSLVMSSRASQVWMVHLLDWIRLWTQCPLPAPIKL